MQKLNAAESIRGLACMAVVFSHLSLSFFPALHGADEQTQALHPLSHWIYHSPFSFWFSGTAAVYVFFVLSGFVLSFAIYRHADDIPNKVQNMLLKRYPRLAIPVLVSCLLTWLLFNTISVDPQQVYPWLHEYLTQQVSFGQAVYQGSIGSFLFAQSSVNWVLWTMQIEFFGSLLLFLLIYLKQKSTVLFFCAALIATQLSYWIWGEGVFLGIGCFVMGMLIYFYGRIISFNTALILCLCALYLAGLHETSRSYQWLVMLLGQKSYDYANVTAAVLLVYGVLMSPQISQALDRKPLLKLGKWSFSIYLLHLPLLYLICVPVLNSLIAWQWPTEMAVIIAIVIFLIGLLFCAALYSRYVDGFAIGVSQNVAQWIQLRITKIKHK